MRPFERALADERRESRDDGEDASADERDTCARGTLFVRARHGQRRAERADEDADAHEEPAADEAAALRRRCLLSPLAFDVGERVRRRRALGVVLLDAGFDGLERILVQEDSDEA